jgi:manganese transport protein
MLYTDTYRKIEKWIIGFVSIIGFSFMYELSIVNVSWGEALRGLVTVSVPMGSIPIIMSVLGAVVMPGNLFLHSEIIQSRKWNKESPELIKRQLKYEYTDTIFSMLVGWVINCAMIILAAASFYYHQINVTELSQAQSLLKPMLGSGAALIFALALFFSGFSSTITAGMAGGSIVAGMFKEPYDMKNLHTKVGVTAILLLSTISIFFISNPFKGLIYSQMFLSIQLPITICLQIYLTSSKKVMGEYKNSLAGNLLLVIVAMTVISLNIMLFISYLH